MEHIHKSKENEMARKTKQKHEAYENQVSSEDSRLNVLLQMWVKKKKKKKKERVREKKERKIIGKKLTFFFFFFESSKG